MKEQGFFFFSLSLLNKATIFLIFFIGEDL